MLNWDDPIGQNKTKENPQPGNILVKETNQILIDDRKSEDTLNASFGIGKTSE